MHLISVMSSNSLTQTVNCCIPAHKRTNRIIGEILCDYIIWYEKQTQTDHSFELSVDKKLDYAWEIHFT